MTGSEEKKIFPTDLHDAIFNFSIQLAQEYARTSSFPEGLEKTCTWLESLVIELRTKMQVVVAEKAATDSKLHQSKQ